VFGLFTGFLRESHAEIQFNFQAAPAVFLLFI
jgi:hypothetical protein